MQQREKIATQHQLLRDCIERLGAATWPVTNPAAEAETLAKLGKETAFLHEILVEHFALEEEGGYLEPVIAKRPGLTEKVAALKAQHATILSMLGNLEKQFRKGTSLEQARASVKGIVGLAARHEVAETDLIQKTLVEDIGTGD